MKYFWVWRIPGFVLNYQKVIKFALSTMRKKTPERKRKEKELLYYLEIYSELNGREGVDQVLEYYNDLIMELIEIIKEL